MTLTPKKEPLEKTERQSIMDNPETLATLGTQDTGSRKTNQNKKQHRKRKRVATLTLPKIQVGAEQLLLLIGHQHITHAYSRIREKCWQ